MQLKKFPGKILLLVLTVLVISAFVLGAKYTQLSAQIAAQISEALPSKTIDLEVSPLPQMPVWTLADQMELAKTYLEQSPSLQFEEKNNRLTGKEIELAILDTNISADAGAVFLRRYWLDEKEIQIANRMRRNYEPNPTSMPYFQPVDDQDELSVVVYWWNNFNSDLGVVGSVLESDEVKISEPARYIVIGNKFLMSNDGLAYLEDKTGPKYSDVVYAPYSKSVRDPAIVDSGKDFLDIHVAQAFEELEKAGVESKAFPGKLVTDTMTQKFVKEITLTEQTDPKLMFASEDGGREQAERVLWRFGANGEKAFRYTVSKTGASGANQIMPRTYDSMVVGFLSANLIKDTDIGRIDIKNSIKAQILVFDDHMATVVNRVQNGGSRARAVFNGLTPDQLNEVRGMIYNGGPSKYNLTTGGLDLNSRGAVPETRDFLRKFRMIRELKIFD